MEKILVFGGTFNPLSIAHGDLFLYAKNYLKASKGILLPTGDRFIKCWKHYSSNDVIDSKIRLEILEKFVSLHSNIYLNLDEYNQITYKTYDTLKRIYMSNQNSEIYFLLGNEKISEIFKWYKIDDLLTEFHFLFIKRKKEKVKLDDQTSNLILKHKSHIHFLDYNNKYLDVSSSLIRKAIIEKNIELLEKYTYNFEIEIFKKEGLL